MLNLAGANSVTVSPLAITMLIYNLMQRFFEGVFTLGMVSIQPRLPGFWDIQTCTSADVHVLSCVVGRKPREKHK